MSSLASGTIRQRLPGLRTGLKNRLDSAQGILRSPADGTDHDSRESYLEQLRSALTSLNTSIRKKSEIGAEWLALFPNLSADELAVEQQRYDDTATNADTTLSRSPSGY